MFVIHDDKIHNQYPRLLIRNSSIQKMNKLFGFFKQKIVEAKVENKKELQSLVSVLSGDDSGYKSDIILSHLQKIKSNYMTWSILIANQASTGLYYSQLHNHSVCLKKANLEKQFESNREKHKIILEQMKKTDQDLKEIGKLSESWVSNMSQNLEEIRVLRNKKLEEKKLKSQAIIQVNKQEPSRQVATKLQKQGQEQLKVQGLNQGKNQENSSPIILSDFSSPIIQFSYQQTNNQSILLPQKW